METHELSFAKINILQPDIAEVIVNEGVELNLAMVEEYHSFLLSHLQPPFSLLINKMHSYTYDFDAQQKLATLPEIHVMAVVAYNYITEKTTEVLASYPREQKWNLVIFSDRSEALDWLISKQEELKQEAE